MLFRQAVGVRMICQGLDDAAVLDAPATAGRNHALQFGLQRPNQWPQSDDWVASRKPKFGSAIIKDRVELGPLPASQ